MFVFFFHSFCCFFFFVFFSGAIIMNRKSTFGATLFKCFSFFHSWKKSIAECLRWITERKMLWHYYEEGEIRVESGEGDCEGSLVMSQLNRWNKGKLFINLRVLSLTSTKLFLHLTKAIRIHLFVTHSSYEKLFLCKSHCESHKLVDKYHAPAPSMPIIHHQCNHSRKK